MKLMCTSLDCPERIGGECNANNNIDHDELLALMQKLNDQIRDDSVDIDPEMRQIAEDNFDELLWK